jgi:hypothetical protein
MERFAPSSSKCTGDVIYHFNCLWKNERLDTDYMGCTIQRLICGLPYTVPVRAAALSVKMNKGMNNDDDDVNNNNKVMN